MKGLLQRSRRSHYRTIPEGCYRRFPPMRAGLKQNGLVPEESLVYTAVRVWLCWILGGEFLQLLRN